MSDPVAAQHEFDRFPFRFRRVYYLKEVWKRFLRPHVNFLKRSIRLVGPARVGRLLKLTRIGRLPVPPPFAIPGIGHWNAHRRSKQEQGRRLPVPSAS